MTLLRLDNVGKSYGGVAALRGVSFTVAAGEIVGLMGANGAGKTTAFSLIAGTQRPTTGEIWFDGARIDRKPPYAAARLGIARTFQIVRPFGGLRVIDNLVVAAMYGHARERSRSAAEDRAREILSEVGLGRDLDRRAETLTLAGRKRLEIARGLMSAPRLLLLDEPSLGLAPTVIEQLFPTIVAIARNGVAVCLVEQDVQLSLEVADYAYMLENGAIVLEGPARDLLSSERVRTGYLGL